MRGTLVDLAGVRNHLSEVVDRLEREHGRVVITKHGKPAVVMLALEDLESLEETLEILSDPALVREIREAEDDIATGPPRPCPGRRRSTWPRAGDRVGCRARRRDGGWLVTAFLVNEQEDPAGNQDRAWLGVRTIPATPPCTPRPPSPTTGSPSSPAPTSPVSSRGSTRRGRSGGWRRRGCRA